MISYKIIIPAIILVALVGLFLFAARDVTPTQAPVSKPLQIGPIKP